jgi:hypothetical protein
MPLRLVPVIPCRLVDTRKQGGPIQGGTFRTFNLSQLAQSGGCANLSSAAAYSLNVTVVPYQHQSLGYLTVWPTGETQPVVSLMNSLDGRIKANATIVPAGTSGEVNVYVTNTTDAVLDVNGYFDSASDNSALAFFPLKPCRVLDTRKPNGDLGGPFLLGKQERDFPVLASSCIPQGVSPKAYSMNFTVVPYDGEPLGYLTVWPQGGSRPAVSTLNNLTGTIVANAAIVPAGSGGRIAVYPTNDTNLVADIDGYFARQAQDGLSLYSAMPCRVIDTRKSSGAFSGTLSPPVDVAGSACGLSSTAQAFVFNATVVPQGALGYLTLWPDGEQQPAVSTLNAIDGAITSNMAIVPNVDGQTGAYASGMTQLILDISSYFAPIAPVSVETSSMPAGTLNDNYSVPLVAIGGVTPYTWMKTVGNLPPGMSFNTLGMVYGAPTSPGNYSFTVQATDSDSPAGTASANLSITVNGSMSILSVITTSLPTAAVRTPYDALLAANGGITPYSWSLSAGSLPLGLSLNSITGQISGLPSAAGISEFTVMVTDSETPTVTASASLIIVVGAQYTDANLKGNYVFTFTGYKNGNLVVMAGAFVANGDGTFQAVQSSSNMLCGAVVALIYTGCLDYNDGSGEPGNNLPVPQYIVAATSNYSIGPNGLGTMVLTTDQGNTFNFHVSIISDGSGTLIQDNADPDERGSGLIKAHTPTTQWPLCGNNVALGLFGTNNSARYAGAGWFQFDPHTCVDAERGVMDLDDGGNASTATFTGAFNLYDPISSRGIAGTTLTPGGRHFYGFYLVSSSDHKKNELILVSTDPVSQPAPLTLWSAFQQAPAPPAGWDNSALAGTAVVELNALDTNGAADVTAGLFVGNGVAGNNCQGSNYDTATFSFDENQGGTSNLNQSSTGTYCVDKVTARVTLKPFTTGPFVVPPVLYLVKTGQAFVVGTDPAATSGYLEPQSGSKFSNISIFGTYSGGTVNPVIAAVIDSVTWLYADGQGNINGTQDTSGPGGPGGPTNFTWTYQVDSTGTGRAVVSGSYPSVMYVVSPTKVIMLPTSDTNPVLSVLKSAPSN